MVRKQGEEEKGGEVEEEMEEEKEGGASRRGASIRDKWMSSHEVTPLANHILSSGGVCPLFIPCMLCMYNTLLGCEVG